MPENIEEQLKRHKIETALKNPSTPLSKWQEFAKTDYGLVSGNCSCLLFLQFFGFQVSHLWTLPAYILLSDFI